MTKTILYIFVFFNALFASEKVLEHLSLEDGLSQSSVYDILQDTKGFMWFATEDGLNKYDGYTFTVLKNNPSDKNSLSHNSIFCLAQGEPGVLWIGTWDGGLNKYDDKTEQFTRYVYDPKDSTSISSNTVYSILVDKNGAIWAGTDYGLNRLDTSTGKFKHYFNNPKDENSLADNVINKLFEDSNGIIWVAGLFDGLSKYNPQEDNFKVYKQNPLDNNSIVENSIYSIAEDSNNPDKIWVGTFDGGIDRLDVNSGKFDHFGYSEKNPNNIPKDEITALISDTSGHIWVGTNSSGLFQMKSDGKIAQTFKYEFTDNNSLAVNDIYSLYKSKSGLLWVGTNGGGLHKISRIKKKFKLYRQNAGKKNILNSNMISGIIEDEKKNLWISSWDRGISIVNREENKARYLEAKDGEDGLNSNNIFMLAKTKDDHILITTENGGLNIYNPRTKQFKYLRHDPDNQNSIASDIVMSVYEDHLGYIWLGLYENGLDRWDRKTNIFTHFRPEEKNPSSLAGEKIYTIHEDNKNNLWIAMERKGLSKYNYETGTFKNYKHDENDVNSLSNDDVISIFQDSKETLWFGTYGGGINRFDYDTDNFTSFKERDGLPNDVVYGILEDDNKNLWLSTNSGLSKFNTQSFTFRNYDVYDGLQSNEFNSAFYKTSDGEMFFGGINGLTSFYPAEIKDNTFIPPVQITKFQIHNKRVKAGQKINEKIILSKSISHTSELHIGYEENVISFEFTALNYFHSRKNKYSYKMEGFDSDWSPKSNRRYASYSNLPPGEYMFLVKGSNNDGVWNAEEASLKIFVEPAYWQTWWFWALIIIASISLIIAAHFYKLYGVKEKNRQLKLINEKLNNEVKERIRVQKQVVASENRFKQLAQATFEAILVSHEGKIIDVNQSAIDIFGYSREEFLEMNSIDLSTPEYHELITEKILTHDSRPYKTKGVKKDGTIISVEIHGKKIIYDNKVLRVTAVTDISEKLKAEAQKENLEKQLRQAQKMEAIGNLAGGVAHDFNNLLTIINGFAELGTAKLKPNHKARRDLDQIISAAEKASQLTRQLLAFSKKEAHKPVVLDINQIILNLDKMISRLISVDISINKDLQKNLPMIFADPGQIEQILLNLIVNARDAINTKQDEDSEKQISISTSMVIFDRTYTASHIESIEGVHVCMEIKDTGSGMSEEVRQKIFEPFYTTKSEGKGTGLGLATVYGIVKQNDANITVESEIDKGTSIKVYWPSTEEVLIDIDLENTKSKHLKGNETILLVEDDEGVRNFASSSLKNYGYKVITAASGNEALELIEKDKLDFKMLVSDMIMPGMNGRELSRELLKRNQDLKFLIISGYSHDYISQDGVLDEGINFLQKPFSVSSFVKKIRTILDKN